MSRIHEALRRAAAAESIGDAAIPDQVGELRVEALAREPYPIELREVRRPRPTARQPEADAADAPADDAPASEPAAPDSPFEHLDGSLAEKVVADDRMMPVCREQYRRLAAVLHDAHGTSGLQVVMVASAVAGEGKTLTACNLAMTLSQSYRRRVLLIDADLRRPALQRMFRLNASAGLADGLESDTESKLTVRQVSPRLAVLPAGRPSADPMAGLTSDRMHRLLQEAKETFDWVIVDTPPLVLLPDAHLLASMVDGAVLVIRAGCTPHELVKRAADALGRKRIVGVVLNCADPTGHAGYAGYGDYHTGLTAGRRMRP